MMQINKKIAFRFLSIFLVLALVQAFTMALQVEENTIDKIEDDPASVAGLSAAEDFDLNVINNITPKKRWIVSGTFNYPGSIHSGAAALRWPFQMYGRLLSKLKLAAENCFVQNYMTAHVLSNLFYLILFLYFSYLLLMELDLAKYRTPILLLSFFGTPLVWYSIFEPTGVSLPLNACLALAFLMLWKFKDEKTPLKWLLLGSIFCLGFTISSDSLFYLLVPIVFCFLQKPFRKETVLKFISFVCGWAVVYFIQLVNVKLQWGNAKTNPLGPFKLGRFFVHEPHWFLRTLVGPNGVFFISPLFFLAALALLKLGVDVFERRQSLNQKERFLISILVGCLAVLFLNPNLFFEKTVLGSGQLSGQVSICVIGLALFFSYTENINLKLRYILSSLCVVWNLVWLGQYLSNRQDFGITYPNFNSGFFTSLISSSSNRIFATLQTFPDIFFSIVGLWTPFIAVLFGLTIFAKRRNFQFQNILAISFVSLFLIVTGLNKTFNRANVNDLRDQNFFRDKVRGSQAQLFYYDDYMKGIQHVQKYLIYIGLKENLPSVLEMRERWTNRAVGNLFWDPIDLSEYPDRYLYDPLVTVENKRPLGRKELCTHD